MIPMRPLSMPEGATLVEFAANQDEYHTLPAAVLEAGNLQVIHTEWELSADELDRVCKGERITVSTLVFRNNEDGQFYMHPLKVDVGCPTT